MPLPRLIPCLDVSGGRVVKGVNFVGLRDVGDPVELGGAYSDAGADELVFLDISATLEERGTLVELVGRVAERLAIPFTVGGGIRSVADAEALLRAGADKVSVNSAALERPSSSPSSRSDSAARRSSSRSTRPRATFARAPAPSDAAARGGVGARMRARAARARSCSRRSTPTGRAPATTSSSPPTSPTPSRVPVIASGGAGEARHVAEALAGRAGRAARVDPARGPGAARAPARRAARPRRPASRCSLSSAPRSCRTRRAAAC